MNNTIFFAVDCQKDFLNPNGALYIKDAELIKPKLKILTDYAAKHNIKVVNTADYHIADDAEISDDPDFKSTFPKHCMIASEGSDFIDETNPKLADYNYYITDRINVITEDSILKARNIILYKNKFDVFEGNKYTEEILNLLRPKKIAVYGIATSICVNFAIQGLLKRNYKVYAIIDAMKGLPDARCEQIFIDWVDKGTTLLTIGQLTKIF